MPRSTPPVRRPRATSTKRGKPARANNRSPNCDELLPSILQATGSVLWNGSLDPLVCRGLVSAEGHPVGTRLAGPLPRPWLEVVDPLDRSRVMAFFGALQGRRFPATIDYRIGSSTPDHRTIWVRHLVLTHSSVKSGAHATCLLTDISDLKQIEAEHLRVSEREKNRIGQDLHDDLCQVLAGLSCLTRVLENRLASRLPEEVDNLREINQQMVDAMNRTRALTHGLFPANMKGGDPRPTLLELAKQVELRFGVKVRLTFRGAIPQHALPEMLQLYRIAQEAISNAIRHGQADSIRLDLQRLRSSMQLTIRDNGIGFAGSQLPTEGIGLQIMRHRAHLLGGGLNVGNAPRRGVILQLQYQPSEIT